MKYNHIIWDWNGTVLDDVELCVDILNTMLSDRGKKLITTEYYAQYFDFPVENFYSDIGFNLSENPFKNIAEEYHFLYEKKKLQCRLQPFFTKLQKKIKNSEITQSILSAYNQDFLTDIIKRHKLESLFQHISGLSHIFADSKIDNGRELIKKIGIPKEKCVYIGDTVHDFDTAVAMQIDCILIPSGHNSIERLRQVCKKIACNYEDFISFLY